MTEILDKENPSNTTNAQIGTPELLEALKGTFDRLNSTIETIQEDRANHDRIKQKKINALRLLAVPVILLVIALSVYMFYMASLMEQAMFSMSKDMSFMRNNMQTMTNSMGKINDNVQILAINVTGMNKLMVQMSSDMQVVSADLHKMSDNMIVMSEDMGKVRKATVYMEYSIRSLTQKVNEMSNAISPVMDGARQFMPWSRRYRNQRR